MMPSSNTRIIFEKKSFITRSAPFSPFLFCLNLCDDTSFPLGKLFMKIIMDLIGQQMKFFNIFSYILTSNLRA